jgi:hypothetical protein
MKRLIINNLDRVRDIDLAIRRSARLASVFPQHSQYWKDKEQKPQRIKITWNDNETAVVYSEAEKDLVIFGYPKDEEEGESHATR